MRLLAQSPQPLGVNEIARAVGVFPSTCLNILRALVREELVAFNATTKRYAVDAGVLALARPLLQPGSLGHTLQPQLDRVARQFSVTATLVEVIGLEHFVVIAVSRAEGLRLQIDIGRRVPALISATGRCVAAFAHHAEGDLRHAFARLRWDNPPGYRRWQREVRDTRARGYGVDRDNYISGMTSVAVPLDSDDGAVRYCLTAVGMTGQMRRAGLESIARALISVAAGLARR